jgi:dTDP-4-dehydrorhamnose reductase
VTTSENSPPRILLIGASGQVGRELLRTLSRVGSLVATTRRADETTGPVATIALDVTNLTALRQVVRDVRPAIVINAAAYTAVDRAETEQDAAALVNGVVPGVLADEARSVGAALVHYSTDYVFDGSGTRPWREDDPPAPLNAYGRTKLAGEEAVRASGAAHLILRISWIYAAYGANFVRSMLRLGAERSELRVVDDQVGAPTSAACVAAATAQIVARSAATPVEYFHDHGGTIHLACAGETSWHGFATEIFRQARTAKLPIAVERIVPIPTSEYPTPARRPLNSRLDGARAAERFDVRLPDWRAALAAAFPAIAIANRNT